MAPRDLVPSQLSDGDLLAEVARAAACEREATAALVALLAEVDSRRLYLGEGCSSLFGYCIERLHLSEHAAYHRIEAARAVRDFPVILEHLRAGALTLTAVRLLRPHLTADNHERLLAAACGRSKREVEVLVRSIAPMPGVHSSLRKLPSPASNPIPGHPAAMNPLVSVGTNVLLTTPDPASHVLGSSVCVETDARHALPALARPAEIRVLAPERYSLRVTLSAEGHARLRRAQDLLRHAVPDGDPAVVVERALALLVEQLERMKFAARRTKKDASGRRDDPAREAGDERATAAATLEAEPEPAARAPEAAARRAERRTGTSSRAGSVLPEQPVGRAGRRDDQRRLRAIPAAVKRAVWARDEGRCAFVGTGGRCREIGRLEFHHRIPVADGGASTLENLELLCTAHHARESELWFGEVPAADGCERLPTPLGTRSGPS